MSSLLLLGTIPAVITFLFFPGILILCVCILATNRVGYQVGINYVPNRFGYETNFAHLGLFVKLEDNTGSHLNRFWKLKLLSDKKCIYPHSYTGTIFSILLSAGS